MSQIALVGGVCNPDIASCFSPVVLGVKHYIRSVSASQLTMVNLKDKQTFYPNPVGAVSNQGSHPLLGRDTGAECPSNSKTYHK